MAEAHRTVDDVMRNIDRLTAALTRINNSEAQQRFAEAQQLVDTSNNFSRCMEQLKDAVPNGFAPYFRKSNKRRKQKETGTVYSPLKIGQISE